MDKEELTKLIDMIWSMYDQDNSGELDRSEFAKLLKDISKIVQDQSLITHMEQILGIIDINGDGRLSKEEFLQLFLNQNSDESIL